MSYQFRSVSDPSVLKTRARIGDAWVDGVEDFAVTDPATGEEVARVARIDAAGARRAVDAAQAAFAGWSETLPQERARLLRAWYDLMVALRDDLAAHHDRRTGQTHRRGAGRDRLRRLVRRVLRRGGAAPKHRRRHLAPARRRGRALARAGGRGRAGDAVELPVGDDHPQGRGRHRRRLHRRRPSLGRDAAFGAGAGRARAARGLSRRRLQRRDRQRPRDRRRNGRATRGCARSASPGRPRSGGCSTVSPPTP